MKTATDLSALYDVTDIEKVFTNEQRPSEVDRQSTLTE